jgi:histidine triad (HIT) family protein
MAYDRNNVFARILRGDLPCHRVYEDEATLVFMDVMPQADGHTLVIPKADAVDFLDLPPAQVARFMEVTQQTARAVKRAFDAPGLMLVQLNGAPAGQTVFHLHFHVIPRADGLQLRFHARDMEKPEILAKHAAMVRDAWKD